MFEYFRDIINESRGLDVDALRNEKRQKQVKEKKDKYIFSKKTKKVILVFASVYVLVSIATIIALVNNPYEISVFIMLRSIISVAIALFVGICIIVSMIKKIKKAEVLTVIGIISFFVITYIMLMVF